MAWWGRGLRCDLHGCGWCAGCGQCAWLTDACVEVVAYQAKDVYTERSPITHAANLRVPVVFFQGTEDRVVPPDQATRMYEVVKGKGLPVSAQARARAAPPWVADTHVACPLPRTARCVMRGFVAMARLRW